MLLTQASRRLETAKREAKTGSPAYSFRSAQECAELSLKAALRFVGVEYPKHHDVSNVLVQMAKRFPRWFDTEKFAEISRRLAEKREPAMYGDESAGIGPDQLFTKKEAVSATAFAKEINNACAKLVKSKTRASMIRKRR